VTRDVLPAIRKTGGYTARQMSRKELAQMIIQQEEEMEVLRLENKQKEYQLTEQKPKVVFADAIVGSKSSCLIGELAKIITQNGYEIGQNRLFAWMRENHYLGTIGEYYNIPCQKYLEQGLFELKKNVHSQNGQMVTTITPKVTGKGQQYFINKFLDR
jgi:anti-repressor protein